MNFFDDDYDFGDYNPSKPENKKQSIPSKTSKDFYQQPKKSSHPKEEFDLLDNLIAEKDKQKINRKSKDLSPVRQIYQSFPNQGDKWGINSNQINLSANINNFAPKLNQFGSRSIIQDKLSEDNRSQRSGGTNKASIAGFQRNIPRNVQPFEPNFPASSIRNMKPPLRKRQSKQTSIVNDQIFISTNFQDHISSAQDLEQNLLPPAYPKKSQDNSKKLPTFTNFNTNESPSKKIQQNETLGKEKEKIIQKIVYVKEDQKQIKEQHEKQIKMIKQSHQRQIKFLQQNLEKQINSHKFTRNQMLKQNQKNIQNQRNKWKKIQNQNSERIKSMLQWQNKKKQDAYQTEIQRMKNMLETATQFKNQRLQYQANNSSKEDIRIKQIQIAKQIKRLKDLQDQLRIRERNIQTRQLDYEIQRKREDDRIQQQKKKLYEAQNQIRKEQFQLKRTSNNERQQVASELANSELQRIRKQQQIQMQKEELKMERQFFERQKGQMEEFNKKIMAGYKQKMQQLQIQKGKIHQLQIQLYKKIHTVQMMASNVTPKPSLKIQFPHNQSIKIKQNLRDQINTLEYEKLKNTQQRFLKLQQEIKNPNRSYTDREKIKLDSYLQKINNAKQAKIHGYI